MCIHSDDDDYTCVDCCYDIGKDDAMSGEPKDCGYKNFDQCAAYHQGYAYAKGLLEKFGKSRILREFDVWYQPCGKCGYDTGKSRLLDDAKCWQCGGPISRDYSDRALKQGG